MKNEEKKPVKKVAKKPSSKKVHIETEKDTLDVNTNAEKKEIVLDTEKVDVEFKKESDHTELIVKADSDSLTRIWSFIKKIFKKG